MIDVINVLGPKVYSIITEIDRHGGKAFLVGGAVRDYVITGTFTAGQDIDIEIHSLLPEKLEAILSQYGCVHTIGKSFGVLRVDRINIDWSLPRVDNTGRKPNVAINPFMSVAQAARRRDLTMNALYFNLVTKELIDPFEGVGDIKNKILRSPDIQLFVQDPLRFFRVMRFIGNFQMQPDDLLEKACKTIDLTGISYERIEQEMHRLFLYSQRPSLALRWLHTIGRLSDIMPELADTIGIQQGSEWHPEGDVFEHSMQTLDAAAKIVLSDQLDNKKALVLLYSALMHDLGKVSTTKLVNGKIKSIGHEVESKHLAIRMIKRFTHDSELVRLVGSLVLHHMAPLQFVANKAGVAAYKRLANKLDKGLSLKDLARLSLADKQGRNGEGHEPLNEVNHSFDIFITRATKAGVLDSPEEAVLLGRDLIGLVESGPKMGKLLEKAYAIQINEGIKDRFELMKRIKIG